MSRHPLRYPDDALVLGTGVRLGYVSCEREVIGLPAQHLMHTWCVGRSGFGKSRWLCSLIVLLLRHGISFTLIDPAGDLAQLVLKQLISLGYFDARPAAFSELLYLDLPAALKRNLFLPFNVLNTGHDPYTSADLVLEGWKRAFPALQGGTATNIETLLKLTAFVLATHRLSLFPHMFSLITDTAYRQELLADIQDEFILQFFQRQTNAKTGELTIAADSTLKRLFLLAFPPFLRYSLGQQANALDFRALLKQHKSVIINLNVPDLEAMRFWGSLVTVSAELGSRALGEIPAEQRAIRHLLIIDEFQNFIGQSGDALRHILEQCRKYGLFLCLAHQGLSQVASDLRGALQNTDLRVVFNLDQLDAEAAAPLLRLPIDPALLKPSPTSSPRYYSRTEQRELHTQAIMQLAKREAFIKLPGDLVYRMQSLDVPNVVVDSGLLAEVQAEYFRRYFRSQANIEAEIAATHPEALSQGFQSHYSVLSNREHHLNATITALPAYAKNNGISEGSSGDDEPELLRD